MSHQTDAKTTGIVPRLWALTVLGCALPIISIAQTYSGTSDSAAPAVSGINTGTGPAGLFAVNNASSPANALLGRTSGSGAAILGHSLATTGNTMGVYGISSSPTGSGLYGYAASSVGRSFGVSGWSNSSSGVGVYGLTASTLGTTYGVWGESRSTSGIGIYGIASSPTGFTAGIYGYNVSANGRALVGWSSSTVGSTYGIWSWNDSSSGYGIYAMAASTTGTNFGVYAQSNSPAGYASYFVGGRNFFSGNVGIGVREPSVALEVAGRTRTMSFQLGNSATAGHVLTTDANGVGTWQALPSIDNNVGGDLSGTISNASVNAIRGRTVSTTAPTNNQILKWNGSNWVPAADSLTLPYSSSSSSSGALLHITGTNASNANAMIIGSTNSSASTATGVQGAITAVSPGASAAGVRGQIDGTTNQGAGVYGSHAGSGVGILGFSTGGSGVKGFTSATTGVTYGGFFQSASNAGTGVSGLVTSTQGETYGGYFQSNSPSGTGVYGLANSTSGFNYGIWGETDSPDGVAVRGKVTSNVGTPYAVWGEVPSGGSGYAGYFDGRVHVNGNLSKSSGSFKIDHPLDPANKYLYHSFVESPDMMNIYNGNVVTDAQGRATIQLPEWFDVLNKDFRYQLTPIGQFAQVIVEQEIKNNRFVIRTDKPKVKVSWQITGIRNDAYARNYRLPVEEVKPPSERGTYLHPELFGMPDHLTPARAKSMNRMMGR